MKVYTTTKVLKKAWQLMKELGVQNLLGSFDGNIAKLDIKPVELFDQLIEQDKLDEFCAIISKKDISDFEEIEFPEKEKLITGFFSIIGNPFKPLIGLVKEQIKPMIAVLNNLALIGEKNLNQK